MRSRPLEHSILLTATLCLLAFGAVMVYSASSAESLLGGSGDPSRYLKRYLLLGGVGIVVMHLVARVDPRAIRRLTGPLLGASLVGCVAVLIPGLGVEVNGATRWLGAGPLQFQPSEVLKFALVLYAARVLSDRPERVSTLPGLCRPLLIVVAVSCALLLLQPDMGTSLIICAAMAALLVAAGARTGHLATLGGVLVALALVAGLASPYRRERLTSFLDPWSDASDTGFQVVQAMIAMGSGGPLGRGLGESVQKIFYLPEAHTDMILAIVGEELGLVGVGGLVFLYGLIAYAGLRTAKLAADPFMKLLAAGLTSLILCQATLNVFAVLGMAPLTGVPLPLVSYGNSNLIVILAAVGVLLSIAERGASAGSARAPLVAVGSERASRGHETATRRRDGSADRGRARSGVGEGGRAGDPRGDRGRRHGGPRHPGPGGRRRALG